MENGRCVAVGETRRITEKILNGEELTDDEKFTTDEVIAGLKIFASFGVTTEQAIQNVQEFREGLIIRPRTMILPMSHTLPN